MGDGQTINNQPRILFITQEDPFYIRIFFEEFLKNYSDKTHILGVAICPTMAKKSTIELVKQMYVKQSIESALKNTRNEVKAKSNGRQIPQIYTRLNRDFYFPK